jgi:hypothetical protein
MSVKIIQAAAKVFSDCLPTASLDELNQVAVSRHFVFHDGLSGSKCSFNFD